MLPSLLLCFLALLAPLSTANNEPSILLTGSELVNDHKRVILQHFYSPTDIDEIFNAIVPTPNILIFGNQLDQFASFADSNYLHLRRENVSTLILTLKGSNELSLEELRLLHKIIYQINGGIVVIEIGLSAVQTKSLLRYSAFCWANGHLKSKLDNDAPNYISLCNGVKPSSVVHFVDERTVVPLNKEIEPLVLPTSPEPRFWPSIVVSAAEQDNKKQHSSKHTAQSNPRHTRVYGKAKQKSESDSVRTETKAAPTPVDKLGCKYRKSCYVNEEPPKVVPTKAREEPPKAINREPRKPDADSAKSETKAPSDSENIDKLGCKYRKSCYVGEDPPPVVVQAPTKELASTEDAKSAVVDDEETSSKLGCRYRYSCYAKAGIETDGRLERKTITTEEEKPSPTSSPKRSKKRVQDQQQEPSDDVHETSPDKKLENKLECKYRKSCYETGELDMEAIHTAKSHVPKQKVEKEDDDEDVSEPDRKLKCKYRKSCYEGKEPPEVEQPVVKHVQSKVEVPVDFESLQKIDEGARKLACKYRKSCLEGREPPPIQEPVQSETKPEPPKALDEQSIKLACKYRKSCMDAHAASDASASKHKQARDQIKPTSHKRPKAKLEEPPEPSVVIEELSSAEEAEDEQRESAEEKPVPTSADKLSGKSKQTKLEPKKKNPNRYVNKFKTMGKYEKIPKSVIVEEEDEDDKSEAKVEQEEDERDSGEQGEAEQDEAEPDEAELHKIELNEAEPDEAEPDEAEPDEAEPDEAEPDEAEPDEAEPDEAEPDEAEPDEAEQAQVEESSTEVTDSVVIEQLEDDDDVEQVVNKDVEEKNDEDSKATVPPGQHIMDNDADSLQKISASKEKTSATDGVDISRVPTHMKLACKYRKSCMKTGVLPDLEEEHKNVEIKETLVAPKSTADKSERTELDKSSCKYRLSCYSQHKSQQSREEKTDKESGSLEERKASHDYKPETKSEAPSTENVDDQDKKLKTNDTVVDLSRISNLDRLNCKYRHSCYAVIQQSTLASQPVKQAVRIPPDSLRIKNLKCNIYYLSCREELGLPPKEFAPKVNGRRLCRKKKV